MSDPTTEQKDGGASPSSRRRGREVALQVLYSIDLATSPRDRVTDEATPDGEAKPAFDLPADEAFAAVVEHFEVPAGTQVFARGLVERVREHAEQVDAMIAAHAKNWRIARMAAVDRNILRLGTFELAYTDTPSAVVLNEAVDLARRFGSDPSPAFVNGILDAVARDVRESAE